jgi:hypothetical protein
VKVARAVVPVLQKVQGQEATVEALTSLVDPNAVNIERAAFAVLGKICTAITDAGNAVAANGINVQLDAQEIADLKSIARTSRGRSKARLLPFPRPRRPRRRAIQNRVDWLDTGGGHILVAFLVFLVGVGWSHE